MNTDKPLMEHTDAATPVVTGLSFLFSSVLIRVNPWFQQGGAHVRLALVDRCGAYRRLACREGMRGSGFGVGMDIVVGMVGSLIGGFLFGRLLGGFLFGGLIGSILVAFIGACIFLWLVRVIKKA